MTISIHLTRGYEALIDDCDADLAEFKWAARPSAYKGKQYPTYAIRNLGKGRTTSMHRVIMERILKAPLNTRTKVDHIDGNGTNNQRSNLRIATDSQSGQNRGMHQNNSAQLKGVYVNPNSTARPWKTAININKKLQYLGAFSDPLEAHRVYVIAALTHFGEFANFGHTSPFQGFTLKDFETPVIQLALPLKEAA